jgi:parvulin-like peptidyl-prolyl isomerase
MAYDYLACVSWLTPMDLPTTINAMASLWHTLLAQTPAPTVSDLVQELEVLKSQVEALQQTNQLLSDGLTTQIEFLKQENQDLTASFSQYIDAMKWNLTTLAGLAAVLSAVGGWLFKNSLDDAKEMATRIVRQELTNSIEPLIEAESKNLQKTLQTEQIINGTVVDYYIPQTMSENTTEYGLLKNRGFLAVRRWDSSHQPEGRFGSVLVVDFVNCSLLNLPGLSHENDEVRRAAYQERDQIVNNIIRNLVEMRIGNPIIVAYVHPGFGRLEALDKLTTTFPELRYYAWANTPVSLMGAVVDSAYVAYGDLALT